MNENVIVKKETYRGDEINVLPIIKELLSKIWIIILVSIFLGAAAFIGTKVLIEPTYRSSFTAYVNNRSQVNNSLDTLSNSDLTAAQQLVRAYSETIHSRNVLSASAQSIHLDVSFEQLSNMVTTEIQNETEIITVYVVDKTPEGAYQLANAIAKTSPTQIADIIEGSSMKIIDMPQLPNGIYKPNYIKNTIIGALAGILIAAAVIIIRYLMDDKVSHESELENRFSLPVVGVIPDMNSNGKNGHNYYDYGYAYKHSDRKRRESNG